MKYCVEYQEHLSRVVMVEADSPSMAINYVRDKVNACELVLDADDYVDSDFDCWIADKDAAYFYEEI